MKTRITGKKMAYPEAKKPQAKKPVAMPTMPKKKFAPLGAVAKNC